jgi:hypothetical protein
MTNLTDMMSDKITSEGRKQSKAGSVAPRLKPFTAMKRAKRETIEPKVCVSYVL